MANGKVFTALILVLFAVYACGQVQNISAVHWNGQTFITWQEDTSQTGETYNIYRHATQIATTQDLSAATLLTPVKKVFFKGRVKENSGTYWSALYSQQFERAENDGVQKPWLLPDANSDGYGEEVPVGYGIFVYTVPVGETGRGYYAVTTVDSSGSENTAIQLDENSLSTYITETGISSTYQPILREIVLAEDAETGIDRSYHYFVQYLDGNFTHFPSIGFEFRLNVPATYTPDNPVPLYVVLHNIGAHEWPVVEREGQLPLGYCYFGSSNSIILEPTEPINLGGFSSAEIGLGGGWFRAWWFGYAEEMETIDSYTVVASGKVVDYSQRRVLQLINWVKSKYTINNNRLYLTGASMGATGSMIFGPRHPELFAAMYFLSGAPDYEWCPPVGGGQDFHIPFLIGNKTDNLLMRDDVTNGEQILAWDWSNIAWYADHFKKKDMPLVYTVTNAYDACWLPWDQVFLPFFNTMRSTKHFLTLLLTNSSSHSSDGYQLGYFTGPQMEAEFSSRTKISYPAFSNCSLNDDCTQIEPTQIEPDFAPPAGREMNTMLNWDESSIIDTSDHYEVKISIRQGYPDGDSGTVDVTPRRLQCFPIGLGYTYSYENINSLSQTIQSGGPLSVDADGLLTIPGATVSKSGNTIRIDATETGGPTPGNFAWSAANYTVGESAGPATITVHRTGDGLGAVSVRYATSPGTAIPPSDYTTANDTLIWPNGDTTDKTFTVDITNDSSFEPAETVLLTLSDPTGGAGITLPNPVTLTINDDDEATPGNFIWSAASYTVGESTGQATITVQRIDGSLGAVSVTCATSNGTATPVSDYTEANDILSWPDGDATSRTFTVPIINDADVESAETVMLTLSNPTGGAGITQPNPVTLTINDDDTAPAPGNFAWSATSYSAGESAGTAIITVQRTDGSSGIVSVTYATSNGTALSGTDYTTASGTLTWLDGDATNKSFTVTIINDLDVESAETVTLTLSNPTGGAGIAGTNPVTLTINDDDTAPVPGNVSWSATSYSVGESAGTTIITVQRTGGSSGIVSVNYATSNGTALSGTDYTTASSTLTWPDGDATSKTFTVPITNDAVVESAETVTLTLSNPTGGAGITGTNPVALTINDDDTAPVNGNSAGHGGGCFPGAGCGLLPMAMGVLMLLGRRGNSSRKRL